MSIKKGVIRHDESIPQDIAASLPGVFRGAISRSRLRDVYHQQNFNHRLYDYRSICMDVGRMCLRWYSGGVYAHDGYVWSPVSDVILESAIGQAFVSLGVDKSDVVRCSQKLMLSLRGGASESPLRVSPSVVGFRNGVWDFSDIDNPVRHDFSEMLPVLSLLDYDYDQEALCPSWVGFLRSILPADNILTLQKYLGLGCVDRSRMSHRVEETLWLVGGGGNGKSTIADVVMGVYGAHNVSNMSLGNLITGSSDVRARFLGGIVGKVFNFCTEVQANDITRYEDAFKSLCSGEPQTVRRIGGDVETARDIPFMIFNMNRKPSNSNMDRAMLRRLIFIPFRASVTAQDMNRELGAMLRAEYSGIRNWMMEGYRRLVTDGFSFGGSEMTDDERRKYMVDNRQTVRLFMDDSGIRDSYHVGCLDEKPVGCLANVLYQEYLKWTERFAYEPDSFNMFGRKMRGYAVRDRRTNCGMVYYFFLDKQLDYFNIR